ncbi:MAG TPA: hypothetical protein VF848_10560 [Steroidobacteraceae bacterium]
MMRPLLRNGFAVAVAALAGCASPSTRGVGEYLDERSGSTLVVVATPLVFARERTDVAAFARDYATLVAVEANNAGKYAEYLLLFRWSTVDKRMSPLPDPQAGELLIQAEGREIDLKALASAPVDLSRRRQLHAPETAEVVVHAYAVDMATLIFIATSRTLAVRLPQETLTSPFSLWEDGRASLAKFAKRATGS